MNLKLGKYCEVNFRASGFFPAFYAWNWIHQTMILNCFPSHQTELNQHRSARFDSHPWWCLLRQRQLLYPIYPKLISARLYNPLTKISVVYHLQKISGQSGWKVNRTRIFGSFQWKISGRNVSSEKVVLFFRCSAVPIKLTSQLGAGGWIGSL